MERYVNDLVTLLRNAKRVQFRCCRGIIDVYSSQKASTDDDDYIDLDPDHVQVSAPVEGTPESEAWYEALSTADFQHVNSISISLETVENDTQRLNRLLATCATAGVNNLKNLELESQSTLNADFGQLDFVALREVCGPHLETFTIYNIKAVDASTELLWNAINPASLTTLVVEFEDIHVERVTDSNRATLRHFHHFTALRSLVFREINGRGSTWTLDHPWFEEICNLISNSLPLLTHLEIADLHTPQLVSLLKNFPQLQQLTITWNYLYSSKGFEENLEQAFAKNVSLKRLSLRFLFMSNLEVLPLFRGIAQNSTLEELHLKLWDFRVGGHDLLSTAISEHKSITEVSFRFDHADWCPHVISCLSKNSTIKCAKIFAEGTNLPVMRVGMLKPSLEHFEIRQAGPYVYDLMSPAFVEELKKNIGIQTFQLYHRYNNYDVWHENTSPAIQRQLLLMRKLSDKTNLVEEVNSLGVWSHLLATTSREKPNCMYKLLHDFVQVWQPSHSGSRKRTHTQTAFSSI